MVMMPYSDGKVFRTVFYGGRLEHKGIAYKCPEQWRGEILEVKEDPSGPDVVRVRLPGGNWHDVFRIPPMATTVARARYPHKGRSG